MSQQSARAGILRRRRMSALGSARGAVAGSLAVSLYLQAALVVTGVLTARSLGATDRGYWALLVLLPAVLQQIGTLGLPLATTYYIATDRAQETLVLRAIRTPALVQVVSLTVVQAIVLSLVLDGQPARVHIAAIATLFLLAGSLADMYGKAILQGQNRYGALNIFRTTTGTLSLIGIVALFAAGHADLVPIATVWVTANFIGGTVILTVALAGRRRERIEGRPISRRLMFRFGLRGFLGSVSPVETFRVDQAVIGLFLPPRELGLYVAALAFTNLPGLISRSIGMIALPHVASVRTEDRSENIWRFFWFSVIATGVVTAVLVVWAGVLVPFFFGGEFEDAVPMTRILLLGAFFYAARRVLTDSASGAGFPGLGSIAELTSWFVLVPLMAVFVGPWGAEGVASALAIASFLSLITLVLLVRRAEGVDVARVPHSPAILGDDS